MWMLFTKASEYALLSIDIIRKSDKPVDVATIAKLINISKSFLAKILQNMAKAGILKSYKGINGGFVMSKNLNEITMLNVITAVEDKAATVFDCSANFDTCSMAYGCQLWPVLNKLQNRVDDFLDGITLDEVIGG
jgi:Rrf2 family protein